MSLTRLGYFVAVAEELSFTRASARLHISQPPLTQQIRRLEQELGEELIVRTTHRISLTRAGRALLPEARRILEQHRKLPALVHEAARSRSDVFSLGCVPSGIIGLVPQLLGAFAEAEPGVSLRVQELHIEDQRHMLRTGDLDVGVFRSYQPPEDWISSELTPDDYVVALPAGHPLAQLPTVEWGALAAERFITTDRAGAVIEFDSVAAACVASGFSPNVVVEDVSGYNRLALVASGLGITVVPGRVTAQRQEGAVYRPLLPRRPAVPLRIAVRPERFDEHAERLLETACSVPTPPL
ncbi:LysR family transcriptional regulator [Streptomyces sp. NPDC059092]|uniref:LysR family transcriptional regulator n=1 Tax=Streptomyces sp. NPDC059092 TaxID=3346725 RepID=UPI00368AF4F8